MRVYTLTIGLMLLLNPLLQADFIPVSIASQTNADIRTYTNGTNYPIGPSLLTVGTVPFNLVPQTAVANSLGVVQTSAATSSGPQSFVFNTNVFGVTTGYSLINSGFGALGVNNGRVTFHSVGGLTASFDLVQGINIRDHFNGFFQNSIGSGTATASFPGDVRLDRQVFNLPVGFATVTLNSITLTGPSSTNLADGIPFVAAFTVQTAPTNPVPAPPSLILFCSGLPLLGLRFVRRKIGV